MSYNPNSGGSGSIASSTDVTLSSLTNGQVLGYNSSLSKWQNQSATSAANATTSAPGLVQLAGDLSGTATSPQIAAGVIVDADVNAGAAIAQTKISGLTTALSAKAPLASPTFTGTVTVPTPTNTTDAATKAYVDSNAGGAGVGSATPLALGSASAGTSTSASRQDHVHPTTGLMLTGQQTLLKAVNIYSGGAYPARPSGYGSVEWIGPVDPGSSASANDTWVNTA